MQAAVIELNPSAKSQMTGATAGPPGRTHLAVNRKVGAATQNQALQALLFLYRHVLEIELPWLDNVTRAGNANRLPVVLTRDEVRALLSQLQGTPWLIASLLYGSGLRLMESLRPRVKDLALERGELIVRDGKGGKDRVTMVPAALDTPLPAHLSRLHAWYQDERRRGNRASRCRRRSIPRAACAAHVTPASRAKSARGLHRQLPAPDRARRLRGSHAQLRHAADRSAPANPFCRQAS